MEEVTNWLLANGVTREILLMLLYVPVIATLVNFSRYMVGMKTLGIYAPMILSFAYIFTGIRFGILVTAAVVAATMLSYTLLVKYRMHYLSRVSINYIFMTFFVLGVIVLNENSPVQFTSSRHDIAAVPSLGIILIATLSDFFIKQYIKKSAWATMRSLLETVLIGFIGWTMIRSVWIQDFLLANFWFYVLLLGINILLGQYTGMRLKDYARFSSIMKNG